ncbi:Bacillibactin transport regulator [uncultured Clostridium sp.]|uniref:helix-turn-helix domain-containing protein n=1 Tax=uncultured Clostridium sp. TaxID=59620 RepID=UPI00082117D0|nr:helix-turn-helix domain-containing protein [uncultured Clostridium sp.]SCI88429.1 Bacillibactin transport regulator [uncultured Clostridium sp.]
MIDMISLDKIKYLCNITSETLKCPTCFIASNENTNYYSFTNYLYPFDNLNYDNLLNNFVCNYFTLNIPAIITTNFKFKVVIINVYTKNYVGSLFIGPLETDTNLIKASSNNLISNPIIEESLLFNWICLLHYSIYNTSIYSNNILKIDSKYKDLNLNVKTTYKKLLSENRQNTFSHHSTAHIDAIYKAVKSGDIDNIVINLQKTLDGEFGVLAKDNEIRSKKNLLIIRVSNCSKAAIDGGVSSETAFTLSDSFIQTIEKTDDYSLLCDIGKKIPIAFAAKVRETLKYKYSKNIFRCIDIINKHLYEDISLSKISMLINLSPQYISSLFKKEVDISLSEYILKCKIDEAKYLLTHTNYSILEISTLLCFHDQSYFTKIFKRFTGITPKKYASKISM